MRPSPQATGERLGTLVESFFGMLLALLISFIYNWVLSLVILGVVPIVMIAGSLEVRAITGQAGQNKRDLESAGKVGGGGLTCPSVLHLVECPLTSWRINLLCIDLLQLVDG